MRTARKYEPDQLHAPCKSRGPGDTIAKIISTVGIKPGAKSAKERKRSLKSWCRMAHKKASRGQQSFIELKFVDSGARQACMHCSASDPVCMQPEWQARRVHYPLIGAN